MLLLVVGFFWANAAHAASNMRSGQVVAVGRDEVINASLYMAGSNLSISGTVKGDVYCAGQNVDITGTVEGDVICAAQTIHVSGPVLGSVRLAAQTISVSGSVARSASLFAQSASIGDGATIGTDLTAFASDVQLNGKVGRDVVGGGQTVTVFGNVGRSATVTSEQVTLASSARVKGDLTYISQNQAQIDKGAVVTGKTERQEPTAKQNQGWQGGWAAQLVGLLYWFGAMLLFGLAMLALLPRTFLTTNRLIIGQGGWALLAGLIALIVTPFVVTLLLVTVIGIPLGLALLGLWVIALVASFVYSSHSVGMWIANQLQWKLKWPQATALVIGLALLALVMLVPLVGGLLIFLALVWGLGGIVLMAGEYLKTRNSPAPAGNAGKSKA